MASLTTRKGSNKWYAESRDPNAQEGERKRKVAKLQVEIKGTPPETLKKRGDPEFEESRREAEKALDKLLTKLEQKRTPDQLAQEVYRAKVGEKYEDVPIDELPARWKKLPGSRDRGKKQEKACQKAIRRFVDWVNDRNKQQETSLLHVSGVTASVAREYLNTLKEAGLSPRTVKFHLSLLRGLFDKLGPEIGMARNPFGKDVTPAPQESGNVVHRKPFNAQEMQTIQKVTDQPVIRGRRYKTKQSSRSVQQDREKGLRRASVRDWHSFRVTWITLALASGIPMEIVTKITGHQTVDVVNRHYWRPQREQIRQVFSEKMPRLLCAGMASRTDRAIDLLRGMTSENWESTRDEVLEILAGNADKAPE